LAVLLGHDQSIILIDLARRYQQGRGAHTQKRATSVAKQPRH